MARKRLRPTTIAVSVGALVLVGGCGGKSEDAAAPEASAFTEPTASPDEFVDPRSAGNKWLPLKPGTQWVREGTTMIGKRKVPHKVISTVTDVIREIDGVKTVLVLDHQLGAGQIVQKSVDYFAQDGAGNVWTMGGVTEEYEAGRFVAIDEAWLDGQDGAEGGILMPADPATTKPWTIAQPPEEDADAAQFERMQPKECVPFDCYDDVLVVREGTKSALDNEFKYYATGVGQIRNEPRGKSKEEDVERLVNVTQLSADGLTEASEEALRIDEKGADEESEVFGDVKAVRNP